MPGFIYISLMELYELCAAEINIIKIDLINGNG